MMNNELNGSVHEEKEKRIIDKKSNKQNMRKFDYFLEQNQRVAHLNMSKDEYKVLNTFIKRNLDVIKPQGLEVEHKITWNAGDKLINTISSGIASITGHGNNTCVSTSEISSGISGTTPTGGTSCSGSVLEMLNMNNDSSIWTDIMSFMANKEFLLSIGAINLIAFGIQRKRINLVAAIACITTTILIWMKEPKDESNLLYFNDLLSQHRVMSSWMDNLGTENSDNMDENIQMENVVLPQGFSDTTDYLTEAIVFVVSLGLGVKAKNSFFGTISNMMRVTDKTKDNISGVLLKVSVKFHEFFSDCIKNDTLANFFYVDVVSDEDVKDLLNRLQEHVASCNAGTAFCEGFREVVFVQLLDETKNILKKLDKHSFDYRILSAAFNDVNKQNTLQKSFSKSLSGERIEPVGVIVHGVPGTFKTVFMQRVQMMVCRYTIPVAWREMFSNDPQQFLYTVPTDKFMDRYTYKAWIATIDDIFQQKEAVGTENPQSSQIISMINTAPYLLRMANADSKNSMYFRSPFVMATTNLPRFDMLEAIIDTTAVERRFNISLKVGINDKYCTKGEIDYAKIPCMELISEDSIPLNSSFIPDDFWNIYLAEWKSSIKSDYQKVTFEQVIERILDAHQQRINNFYINKVTNDRSFESLASKLDEKFLRHSKTIPKWVVKPQEGVVVSQSLSSVQSDMEIRPTTDSEGNVVYVPMRAGFTDNFRNVRSNFEAPKIELPFGTFKVPSKQEHLPGSFIGSNYDFDRNNSNPILDYVFNRHPTMFEGFHLAVLNYAIRNNRASFFDANLVQLNMHLTALKLEDLVYILLGLDCDDFFQRLESSLAFCDLDDIDYFTLEPKFWRGTSLVRKLYDKVSKFTSVSFNFVKKHYMQILIFGGLICAGGYYLWKMYKRIMSSLYNDDNFEAQSVDQTRMASKGYSRRVGKPIKLSKFVKVSTVSQGLIIDTFEVERLPKLTPLDFGARNGSTDIMSKICNKYLFVSYIFYREKDTGKTAYRRLGHMLNLTGQVFLHPFHYIFHITDFMQHENRDSFQMVMVTPTKSICYRFPMSDFLENFCTTEVGADGDKCLFVCPHAHSSSAGAMKYMLLEDDIKSLRKLSRVKSTLLGTYNAIETKNLSIRMKDVSGKILLDPTIIKAGWTGSPTDCYGIENAIEYEADLTAGDCGSLLFSRDGNFQNRIILGMHIAGSEKLGFSSMTTKGECLDMMSECNLKILAFHDEEEPDFIDYITDINPQAGLVPSGVIHRDEAPSSISSSNILKSKLHGKLPSPYDEVKFIPSKLFEFKNENGDIVNPGKIALKNYKHSPGCIPYEYIEMAADSYGMQIRNASASYPHERSVIPLKEALHHFRDVKPIASSTSPGHPLALPKYLNYKKEYFKAIEKGDTERAEIFYQRIATEVDRVLGLYRKYTRPFFMYTDNLKDETRKREKALKGMTRLFSGCPFILLIMFRMYFGAFMDMYFTTNLDVGSAIGLNPYSMDWDRLARRLQQFGKHLGKWLVGAGDFAHFDGSEINSVLEAGFNIIRDWYGRSDSEANMIRFFLWAEIVQSRHAFEGMFYDWFTAMPSGNPMTTIINTMYNNLVFRIAFQFAGHDVDDFNADVFLVCLGDDVLFAVAPYLFDTFNELTMPILMKQCGMEYTNELKEKAVIPFRELEEVEFLKRGFVKHKGLNRWIAPLRAESIVNMVCWTNKDTPDQTAVDNIGIAIREFSLHGEETYNFWFSVLNGLWQSLYPNVEMNGVINGKHSTMLKRVLKYEQFTF